MMTKDHSVEQLEKFILWITENEEIPADERVRLIDHILKTGKIDENASLFVEHWLHQFEIDSHWEAKEAKRNADSLRAALAGDKLPELSLKENIVRRTEKDITGLVSKYKTRWTNLVSRKRDAAEFSEQTEEKSEVASLKKNL